MLVFYNLVSSSWDRFYDIDIPSFEGKIARYLRRCEMTKSLFQREILHLMAKGEELSLELIGWYIKEKEKDSLTLVHANSAKGLWCRGLIECYNEGNYPRRFRLTPAGQEAAKEA